MWARVSTRQPSFDQTLETFLSGVECYMIEEPELVVERDKGTGVAAGTVRHVIAAESFELRLRKPDGWWEWDLVELLPAKHRDGQRVRVEDEFVVYKPDGVFRDEVAFVIDRSYRKLAGYLKAPIGLAWRRIVRGREVRRVFWEDDVIFLLTPTSGGVPVFEGAEDDMNEALESVGAGRVITDPYELRKIREMAVRFGETLHT
jgi:hypothetical protein